MPSQKVKTFKMFLREACKTVNLVSQYEHHYGLKRSVCEETADQKIKVYIKGLNLTNCDAVVLAALYVHFEGRRKSNFLHAGSLHSFS